MKRLIFAISIIALITLVFSSCKSSIYQQEKYISNLEKTYNNQLLENFKENEKIFNDIVISFAANIDEFAGYQSILLYYNTSQLKYILYTYRRDEANNVIENEEDFFKNKISNNINKIDLDKIFIIKNDIKYKKDGSSKISRDLIKYWVFYFESEKYMWFDLNWSWGSEIQLVYSKSGEMRPIEDSRITVHKEYWINEHWYIQYAFQQKG